MTWDARAMALRIPPTGRAQAVRFIDRLLKPSAPSSKGGAAAANETPSSSLQHHPSRALVDVLDVLDPAVLQPGSFMGLHVSRPGEHHLQVDRFEVLHDDRTAAVDDGEVQHVFPPRWRTIV